jgi:hypothetical protein
LTQITMASLTIKKWIRTIMEYLITLNKRGHQS